MASYGHSISTLGGGDYRLGWLVDHKYARSRLRFPRGHWRDTDADGAIRFAIKHDITKLPASLQGIVELQRMNRRNRK